MVGDGVNDAAALAAATVGIAVDGGAEASLAAADIYLSRPGLAPIVELIEAARETVRTIHRNFGLSLCYNVVAAGRCVDADVSALSAIRVMGPCIAMGTAAAHALDLAGSKPVHEIDLMALQTRLTDNLDRR